MAGLPFLLSSIDIESETDYDDDDPASDSYFVADSTVGDDEAEHIGTAANRRERLRCGGSNESTHSRHTHRLVAAALPQARSGI